MKKLALTLCFIAGTANASSSLNEVCTDYVKYLGHAYGFATTQDESMRKLLLADMKNLSLSEVMVQKEMYKAVTDDATKIYYSKFLNPNLNDTNRAAFSQMVSYCETGPDMMIPSWAVLVAKGKVRKEDAGKSINSYIQSDEFQNSRSMRQQKVEGTLRDRMLGPGKSPEIPTQSSAQISNKIKNCADDKFIKMKADSPNVPEQNLMATAISLCEDGL